MATVLGVDVSTYQDSPLTPQVINWQKTALGGVKFAFIRSSGSSLADDDFALNWANAKAAGLLRGAYHFYDYRLSPRTQAQFFCKRFANDPGELPPVLDLEYFPPYGPLPSAAPLLSVVKEFLTVVEELTGKKAIFYTNPSTITFNLASVPAWLLEHPLWIAHYIQSSVPSFRPWPKWTFWQYTNKGDGLGLGMESREVDLNFFNGTLDELRAFAGVQPKPELSDAEKLRRLWEAHPELHD